MKDPMRGAAGAAAVLGPMMDGSGGPLGVVGRSIGLGADEIEAGIPGWAWFGIGVISGGIAMYLLRDKAAAFVGD
jgi:hypothetical protein